MFAPLILSLIISLIVVSINSIYALSSHNAGYWSKSQQTLSFLSQERILNDAANSLCRLDYPTCKAKTNDSGEIELTVSDLVGYLPSTFSTNSPFVFYSTILSDADKTSFILDANITIDQRRREYVGSSFGKVGTITCINGSDLPCSSPSIEKTILMDPDTRLVIVEDRIVEIDALLATETLTLSEEISLNIERAGLNAESETLTSEIANRETLTI